MNKLIINNETLIESVIENRLDIVQYLVENGVDIYHNHDALYLSIINGYMEIFHYLISHYSFYQLKKIREIDHIRNAMIGIRIVKEDHVWRLIWLKHKL